MSTTVINFYGGPGAGKSTTAADTYAKLKLAGVNCELVREYVKDWAWDSRRVGPYDQLYLFGKQVRRESMLFGKVDVIVTDSPVVLGAFYAWKYSPAHIAAAVETACAGYYRQSLEDGHKHIHVMLERTKPYVPVGRYQSEAEARGFDAEIEGLLRHREYVRDIISSRDFDYRDYIPG